MRNLLQPIAVFAQVTQANRTADPAIIAHAIQFNRPESDQQSLIKFFGNIPPCRRLVKLVKLYMACGWLADGAKLSSFPRKRPNFCVAPVSSVTSAGDIGNSKLDNCGRYGREPQREEKPYSLHFRCRMKTRLRCTASRWDIPFHMDIDAHCRSVHMRFCSALLFCCTGEPDACIAG